MIFPFERFTITTALPPDIVREKLISVVEPPSRNIRWGMTKPDKPYQGKISESYFEISRIINYRNSFIPVIKGRIYPDGTGSKIHIEMTMHPFVMVFMAIWLSVVGQAAVGVLIAAFSSATFDPTYLTPLGMFLVGLLICPLGFRPEANGSKKFLIDLLER
ncbi:hypothetical protein [[Phormidium] sp. ETS-05]|uniref:hypothetical protein n=1 Tax=[Phormidium] sp. ETS-05 TaxID=222819 RepID=UPI001E2F515B|nr:hypothetical protein [[Phormidium] sp. ETS-05]